MSWRSALSAAIVASLVVVAFFVWPETARADLGFSARFGGKIGHSARVGARLHVGDRAALRGGKFARGARHFGRKDGRVLLGDRFRFHQDRRLFDGKRRPHGALLGDRFRWEQQKRLSGSRPGPHKFLLGDRMRFEQGRRLDDKFLGPDRRRAAHRHKWLRQGKALRPRAAFFPFVDSDVVISDIVVPAPVSAPVPRDVAAEARPLDPGGAGRLVHQPARTVDWAPDDKLPDGLPLVALDPVTYGLPELPLGQKYARVGNDVLRIDAGTRRVMEVIRR
jgi:hypothetical protein